MEVGRRTVVVDDVEVVRLGRIAVAVGRTVVVGADRTVVVGRIVVVAEEGVVARIVRVCASMPGVHGLWWVREQCTTRGITIHYLYG